jgi:predicted ATPase
VQERDFRPPVSSRGGIVHLAWKGEDAQQIELTTRFAHEDRVYEWTIHLRPEGFEFSVDEVVIEVRSGSPPIQLLLANSGAGWWWSGESEQVQLKQNATACALSAAAADATFPARGIAEFVNGWGFFDPSPFSLRRGWPRLESSRLDPYGRNLAERLFSLQRTSPDTFKQIESATQSILGLPTEIEPRESEGRFYFAQREPGLRHSVHQIGASSGTLRMLALITALLEETGSSLIGIEEPENHIHPTALAAFAEYLQRARKRVQILVTTHSRLLLDFLNDPAAVCVVRHNDELGTQVNCEKDADAIRRALEASDFGLGEFYETKGFGG